MSFQNTSISQHHTLIARCELFSIVLIVKAESEYSRSSDVFGLQFFIRAYHKDHHFFFIDGIQFSMDITAIAQQYSYPLFHFLRLSCSKNRDKYQKNGRNYDFHGSTSSFLQVTLY